MKRLCEIVKEIEAANPQTTIGKREIQLLGKAVDLGWQGSSDHDAGLAAFNKHIGSQSQFDLARLYSDPVFGDGQEALHEFVNEGLFAVLDGPNSEQLKQQFKPEELVMLNNISQKHERAVDAARQKRRAT